MAGETQKMFYSLVQFRVDPAESQSEGKTLGFLIGFSTPRYQAVGLIMRATLEREFLDSLDDLSREVVEHRAMLVKDEISEAMELAARPEEILRVLAQRNYLSLYVTPPKSLKVNVSAAADVPAAKLAEDYSLTVYHKVVEKLPAQNRVRNIAFKDTVDLRVQRVVITPPWMLPPELWMLPKTRA